jgi:hypothetical protein
MDGMGETVKHRGSEHHSAKQPSCPAFAGRPMRAATRVALRVFQSNRWSMEGDDQMFDLGPYPGIGKLFSIK